MIEHDNTIYLARVSLRNPFLVKELPVISRIQRLAYQSRRRASKRLVGKPSKKLFRLLYSFLKLKGTGVFQLRSSNENQLYSFNARNTQYGSLFLPQYKPVYEPEVAAIMDLVIRPNDVIYDVGSNWGYFSLYILSNEDFQGTVHAFEPVPDTYKDLASTCDQSPYQDRFKTYNVAISDRSGISKMSVFDNIQSGLARISPNSGSIQVDLTRLDEMSIADPDFIKLDVEGHEAKALEGAKETINRSKPLILFENWIENSPQITLRPFRILEQLDYKFYQPAWLGESTEGFYSYSGSPKLNNRDGLRVALIPILPEQRFLLEEQINIFAIHHERLSSILPVFKNMKQLD